MIVRRGGQWLVAASTSTEALTTLTFDASHPAYSVATDAEVLRQCETRTVKQGDSDS